MSALSFGGINIRHPEQRKRERGENSSVYLSLFTPSGQLREVPLSRSELIRLIDRSTSLLTVLEAQNVTAPAEDGESHRKETEPSVPSP